jgi:hypothetical protein
VAAKPVIGHHKDQIASSDQTMILFTILLTAAFLLALFFGLRFFKSGFWNYVDLIYYPLAAVGVALLFANTTAQRQLLELSQLEETHRKAIAALVEQRPQVQVNLSQELVDASFGVVATVPKFAEACQYPGNIDPRCSVAKKLAPSIADFLKAARSSPEQTLEQRLSIACPAADKMIAELREHDRMSSLIGDELVSQYKEAVGKGLSALSIDPLKDEIDAFKKHADSSLNLVRTALNDKSEAAKYVMETHLHEIEFGKILMQGLFPCIISARKDVEVLANWTRSRRTEEDQLAKLDVDRKKISSAGWAFPRLARLHLFIWPYFLILALSLKFAKGVAAVKKHRSTSRPPLAPSPEDQQAALWPSNQLPLSSPSESPNDHETRPEK